MKSTRHNATKHSLEPCYHRLEGVLCLDHHAAGQRDIFVRHQVAPSMTFSGERTFMLTAFHQAARSRYRNSNPNKRIFVLFTGASRSRDGGIFGVVWSVEEQSCAVNSQLGRAGHGSNTKSERFSSRCNLLRHNFCVLVHRMTCWQEKGFPRLSGWLKKQKRRRAGRQSTSRSMSTFMKKMLEILQKTHEHVSTVEPDNALTAETSFLKPSSIQNPVLLRQHPDTASSRGRCGKHTMIRNTRCGGCGNHQPCTR